MRAEKNLPKEESRRTAEHFNPERVRRLIFDYDERLPVSDTSGNPFCAVGRIDYGCTAVLIGPYHAITAAHCVYDNPSPCWLSFGYYEPWSNVGLDVIGYPLDKPDTCFYNRMWSSSCHYSETAHQGLSLFYRCDTALGNDGLPSMVRAKGMQEGYVLCMVLILSLL